MRYGTIWSQKERSGNTRTQPMQAFSQKAHNFSSAADFGHQKWRFGGGSYQSSSDPRLNFGLGEAGRAEGVEVTWPSGRKESFGPLAADRAYRLREGDGRAKPLAGFTGSTD